MNSERWKKVDEIFEAAAERAPGERAAFLEAACAGDEELRREVESLLRHQQETGAFLPTLFLDAAKLLRGARPDNGGGEEEKDDSAGFVPGHVLAERYRLVAPLGRGGMGEVYRADDLKLRQEVALKFLPEKLSKDPAMLARFHGEVRTARRVSHPNVCRVFDIGETGGQHFLSMEYIDGEDLSSLLRRIGRLPEDKAVEVSRQICAGLAAAHAEGVLHRDLKPANVMIDGRGRARITDFGLAGLASEIKGRDLGSGTPAYMAPEQLAGREVSVRSDIYSLGLLLYEVFTGRKAFDAPTFDEMLRLRESSSPPSISSFVKDVDPLVERVIGRCLETDPSKRPDSALKVAAALPGGDPLAAALAAGETPSPEMVAAAPKEGALRPALAVSLLALVVGVFAFNCLGPDSLLMYRIAPLTKSPEVLADHARNMTRRLGYTDAPADTAHGFDADLGYLSHLDESDRSPERWRRFTKNQPGLFLFWYRQSPRPLEPRADIFVAPDDPSPFVSGMVNMRLDSEGRLLAFDAAPQQLEATQQQPAPVPEWKPLFDEAGLDMETFSPSEPRWVPPHMSDARAAWEGHFPNAPDIPLRVEAASYRGKAVYFEIIAPWTRPSRVAPGDIDAADKRFYLAIFAIFMVVIVTAGWLVRRNLRTGRGDRRGATRLALLIFSLSMLGWVIGADHVSSVLGELYLFWFGVAKALIRAAVVWVLYVALEPYVRRRFPELIISWSRLLGGDFRDPMVGRDILIGMACFFGMFLFYQLLELLSRRMGLPAYPHLPYLGVGSFTGLSRATQWFLDRHVFMSLLHGLAYVFVLFLASLPLRKRWMAGVGLWLLLVLLTIIGSGSSFSLLDFISVGLRMGMIVFVTARFGLLAMTTFQFSYFLIGFYPYTSDLSAWYAEVSIAALLLGLTLAFYSFRTSLAGQPLVRGAFPDD